MSPTAEDAPCQLGPDPWAVVFDLDETLIVEERDIAGALGVGMRAIWIERTGTAPAPACRPHARVRTLTEVPPLLTAWRDG